jgi:hypothetical protein
MEPKIGRFTPSALPRHVIVDSMEAGAMQGPSHPAPQADPVTRSTSPRAQSRPFRFSLRPLVAASHRPATGVKCAELLTTRDARQGWRRHRVTLDVTIGKRLRPGLATAIGAFCAPAIIDISERAIASVDERLDYLAKFRRVSSGKD